MHALRRRQRPLPRVLRTRTFYPGRRGVFAHPVLAVNSDASSPVVMQADIWIHRRRPVDRQLRQGEQTPDHPHQHCHSRRAEHRHRWRGDRRRHHGSRRRVKRGRALPGTVHSAGRSIFRRGARSGDRNDVEHDGRPQSARRSDDLDALEPEPATWGRCGRFGRTNR